MVSGLKRGDQVVTTSGMFGKVALVEETSVTIEVAKGVKIKFLKDKVATTHLGGDSAVKADEHATKKK